MYVNVSIYAIDALLCRLWPIRLPGALQGTTMLTHMQYRHKQISTSNAYKYSTLYLRHALSYILVFSIILRFSFAGAFQENQCVCLN